MKIRSLYFIAGILFILALLIVLTRKNTSLSRKESNIGFDETDHISVVELAGKGCSVSLSRTIDGWILNDSLPVKPGLAETFLTALSTLQVKAPAGRSIRENIIKYAIDSGVHVKILTPYSVLREYDVCNLPGETGTWLLPNGTRTPVRIELPGFNGEPFKIFRTSWQYWNDQVILTMPLSNISAIRIINKPSNEALELKRKQPEGNWSLISLKDSLHPMKINLLALNDMLSGIKRLPFSAILTSNTDSARLLINHRKPIWIVQLTGFSGTTETAEIYTRPLDDQDLTNGTDPDIALGWLPKTHQLVLVKYTHLDKVLVDPEYLTEH